MIKSSVLAQAGKALLAKAQQQTIPYVSGGMTLAGMDCQGLVEYLLMECGISRSECNLAGSNAHFRSSLSWRGTPEEAVAKFGSVPIGAALFIWEESGEPSKYAGDGIGNANHMGLKLSEGVAIHASSSRGCVAQSVFKDKTVRNGGWNQVGLLRWVDYGIGGAASDDDNTADGSTTSPMGSSGRINPVDVSGFYKIKKGCLGNAVRRLQTWLLDMGFDLGDHGCDGNFGSQTKQAVLLFQRLMGLAQDGIVGQKTWTALAAVRAKLMGGLPGIPWVCSCGHEGDALVDARVCPSCGNREY